MPTNVVTGLFNTYDAAERAVRDLEAAGVPDADISLIANRAADPVRVVEPEPSGAAVGAGTGAGVGGAVGAGAGLLAGLGIMAIPGVGPVVAAGWLVATAVGAVVGAAAGGASGGIIGSLTDAGVSKEHAHVYAEGVRRGGTLVTARVDASRVAMMEAIMQRHGRLDRAARERLYRDEGWTAFDESAPPYTAEEIARDRVKLTDRPVV
jgi:hypothetical protein